MIKELSVDFDVKRCCEALGVSRKRVARLMEQNKLAARGKKAFRPRTTLPGSGAAQENYLCLIQTSPPCYQSF
jgi:hypothetical protein